MTIERFYITTFTVKRMQWATDGDGNEYSEEADASSFEGHLQQSSTELAESMGLAFNKTFTVWCPVDTDIAEGDSISDGLYTYHVRALQEFDDGKNAHLELVCERELEAD